MRSAVISAAAVMTGCSRAETEQAAPPTAAGAADPKAPAVPLFADLNVVKKGQGPVMTVLDEFYKVGPGPSSSHTIGPMRITYDFYQRCTKLPADQLAKATGLKVHLFGSLSATGKATAPNAPRSPGSSARSRPPSIRCSSTRCATNPISRSR